MNEIFCDTLYHKALVDRNDQYHKQALRLTEELRLSNLISSHDVFAEALNFVSAYGSALRQGMTELLKGFSEQPNTLVLEQNPELFQKGWSFYCSRTNKQYSLTDCISMIVMRERGIQRALTNDRHFQQEGFQILFVS